MRYPAVADRERRRPEAQEGTDRQRPAQLATLSRQDGRRAWRPS
jgi:hypothetical protein